MANFGRAVHHAGATAGSSNANVKHDSFHLDDPDFGEAPLQFRFMIEGEPEEAVGAG